MKKIKETINLNFISIFFLLLICVSISTAAIVFLIGGHINKLMFVFNYILTIYLMILIFGKKMAKKKIINNLMISTVLFFTFCSIALVFYDVSWDGNVYHKQMIGLMKNGMNPFFNRESGDIWVQHYANATEIWGAELYALFGNIEVGKVINLLLSFSLYIISYNYIFRKTSKKIMSHLFAFALTFNPIMLGQFTSYYLDGVVASTLFILIIALLNIIDGKPNFDDKENLLILATSIIICVNSKFTALLLSLMFAGLLGGYTVIYYCVKKNISFVKKYIVFLSAVFLFAITIVGSSSYMKNMIYYGHPFYPLMGDDTIDIETNNEPKSFKEYSHIEKWIYATFSETNTWYDENPKLKIPFTIHSSEMNSIRYPDIRIGGLGLWYGGMLLISVPVLLISTIVLLVKKSRYFWVLGLLLAGIILPIPILPVVWQARYYPELYLLPFIAITVLLESKKKIPRALSYLLVLLAIGNGIIFMPQVYEKFKYSIHINNDLVCVAEQAQLKKIVISQDNYTFYGAYYNLLDKNINFEYEEERMENGTPIYFGSLYRFEEEK